MDQVSCLSAGTPKQRNRRWRPLPGRMLVFVFGPVYAVLIFACSAVRASYVGDLIRCDGSLNSIFVELRAGVWRPSGSEGTLVMSADTSFSSRVPNEVIIGVFRAIAINGVSNFSGEFTGYFAFGISSAQHTFSTLIGPLATKVRADYSLGPLAASDPFSVVGGVVALAAFLDPTPEFGSPGSGIPGDVVAATDGQVLGTFGFLPAADKDLGGAPGDASAGAVWQRALSDRLQMSGGLNLAEIGPDFSELIFTGVSNPLSGQVNSLAFRFEFVRANSGPWPWGGEGSLEFRVVPEPSSGLVMGGLILGGALLLRAKRFREPSWSLLH